MSLKLVAISFASMASAQLTTSMWFPSPPEANASFVGSVMERNGDRTTVSLDYQQHTAEEDFESAPATVTLGGTTYFGFQQSYSDDSVPITIGVACSRKDASASPTCLMSTMGYASVVSSLCKNFNTQTADEIQTMTRVIEASGTQSATVSVETFTIPAVNDSELPEFCTESQGSDSAVSTLDMDDLKDVLSTFQLVLTAGTEKLSAAATPTGGAKSTGTSAPASGANSASGAKSTGTSEKSTGAAPIMTAAPMLAGLGAAAAAIFL